MRSRRVQSSPVQSTDYRLPGLFCVLNSNGEVLSWKLTKSLCFASIEDQLLNLKQRLSNRKIFLEEFYIDNCCSWRHKLQDVFGSNLKVFLDIFHAVQRVSKKIPKRHAFYGECIKDLKFAFRDPSDKGSKRLKPTPSRDILKQSLLDFQCKWQNVTLNGKHILPPAAAKEVYSIIKHVERGCLSGIKPGRGTNRNERLHRELNKFMSTSRYGVELGYALITSAFYHHNENLRAAKHRRVLKPINAYSCSTEQLNNCETFGLATCQPSQKECGVEQQPSVSRKLLREYDYNTLNLQMKQLVQSFTLEEEKETGILSQNNALSILQQVISHYFISQHLFQTSKSAALNHETIFFVSFLAYVQNGCSSSTDVDAHHLENVLSSWDFMRVPVPGDGNCLFSAVSLGLIERLQNEDHKVVDVLTELGIPTCDFNVTSISTNLRSLVVKEWLGDNADYYQGFVTSDIRSQAELYLSSGEFAGNLGDLIVVTLSNILHIPITIFTSIQNLPVICITPLSEVETVVPLYLTYTHTGPGHYDYAIKNSESCELAGKHERKPRCYCGRKKDFMGIACFLDMQGHCRCPCSKRGEPCTANCNCKGCGNKNGVRPTLTTRVRKSYDNQKQPLCGRKGTTFLHSVNEQETVGHATQFEKLLFSALIIYFVLFGIDVTAETIYQAYCTILEATKLCCFVDLPLFQRSQQFITRYMRNIEKIITLFHELLMK